ncbi:MAG TPA: TonB-dependent receptor plug domain-containing protein [Candidatus Acidoferrales bacterium]|nr:TonB-dependent receptor plug domain-containing protein [Candidatus Acidoferrales bacterium]
MTARFVLACFLIAFLPIVSHSQASTVTGRVLDPNRKALPRATVRLLDGRGVELDRTLTDSQGEFRLAGPAGTSLTLSVELVGFRSVAQPAEPGVEAEIQLPLAPVREEIVVTATRTETPTSQLGANTSVLDSAEIEDRQAASAVDLLRALPAATVTRLGGLGTVSTLFIRGGESDHNKIFLDGVPLNEPGGFFDFSNWTPENLERIEVVRGPQSALFGSDAMASAVQLFTARGRSETRRPRALLSAEGGNNDTWRTRAGLSGAVSRFDYSLQWARLSTDNREPNNVFHDTTLSTNLGLELNRTTTLRAILRGELGRVGTPGQTAFGRPDSDSNLRRRDAAAALVLRNQTTSAWEQQLRYNFSVSRQVSRNLLEDPPFVPSFEGHTAPFAFFDFPFDFLNHVRRHQVSYQSDLRLGRPSGSGLHLLTFAFEWDRERGSFGDRLFGAVPTDAGRDNFGSVVQHQAIWQRLTLTNGLRVENNSSFGTSVVPRSSVAYQLRSGGEGFGSTKLKFNFGLGIKEPSLVESFSAGPFTFGNPDLAPERVRSFDAGVEQRFWRERGKLEVNWFDNRWRDLIAFRVVSFVPFAGSFFNVERSQGKGAEVVLELAPGWGLRGIGSYTWLDSQVTRSNNPFDPVFGEGNSLFRRPRHSGSLRLFWDWRRLNITSSTVFVGRRVDSDFSALEPPLTSSRPYTKWDLAGTYRTTYRVSYFGVVENFLNQDYMEALGYPALKLTFRAGARVEF